MSPLTPYIAGGALLTTVAAGAWIDHRGYQRGYKDREVVAGEQLKAAEKKADGLNAQLVAANAVRDAVLNERQTTIQTEAGRQQTIILKETASAPRYRDPACELTGGVFDAINASRSLSSGSAAPDGPGVLALPASAAPARR